MIKEIRAQPHCSQCQLLEVKQNLGERVDNVSVLVSLQKNPECTLIWVWQFIVMFKIIVEFRVRPDCNMSNRSLVRESIIKKFDRVMFLFWSIFIKCLKEFKNSHGHNY